MTFHGNTSTFKYFICLDFEATCWPDKKNRNHSEIIEIAAILLNTETGLVESTYHRYVKPTMFPKLSSFCIELTGIKQRVVDSKERFPVVYADFVAWLLSLEKSKHLRYTSLADRRASDDGPNATFCSWSNHDLKSFFRKECERNGIQCPGMLKAWVDIQRKFEIMYKGDYHRPRNLVKALERAKIDTVGRAHSGICDATNLAKLVMHLIKGGIKFGAASEYYR